MEEITLDDAGPFPVVSIRDRDQLCDVIRDARSRQQALYPIAGRTMLSFGGVPARPGIAVDLRGLNQVDEYPARDLTVTLDAGATIQQLQTLLAQEQQYLPIDIPHPERATLGGAIACNQSGPRRYAHGTLRDYVIGIQFASDEGVLVRGGGRVVKNVAGYDLMKLHTGALGTLGILTQVTLKVKPHPETSRFVLFGLNGSALGPTLDRLHESPARPAALELLNDAACRSLMTRLGYPMLTAEPWWLLCGFEEKESTVGWQVQTLQDDLRTAPVRNLSVMTAAESLQIWQGLADGQNPSGSLSALQVSVRPSQVALLAERANALRSDLLIQAHAGNGIVRIHADNDVSLEEFSRIHQSLLAGLPREGRIVVLRCPAPWKKHLAIWGPKTSSSPLRAEIKRTLDPDNLFNPGRL